MSGLLMQVLQGLSKAMKAFSARDSLMMMGSYLLDPGMLSIDFSSAEIWDSSSSSVKYGLQIETVGVTLNPGFAPVD